MSCKCEYKYSKNYKKTLISDVIDQSLLMTDMQYDSRR